MTMTLDRRIRFILDGPATFARGGGGAKGSKAGGKKKSKGLGQGSTKGGKCCKTPDGKFAPGNNYGSKGGGSGGSLKAGGKAGQRAISSLVARTRAANAAAAAAKQAKAAKTAAATPARATAIGRMVAKSRQVAGNKMVAKTEREMAASNAAERGKAVGRMVERSKGAAERAGAAKAVTPKAFGRGTPERAAKAAAAREARAGVQRIPAKTPITEKTSTKGGVKTVTISRGPASVKIVASGGKFNVTARFNGKDETIAFDTMRQARSEARGVIRNTGYVHGDGSLRSRRNPPARAQTRPARAAAARGRSAAIGRMVKGSKTAVTGARAAITQKAHVENMAKQKAKDAQLKVEREQARVQWEKDSAARSAYYAERRSRGLSSRPLKDDRGDAFDRRERILDRARENLAEARESLGKGTSRRRGKEDVRLKRDRRGRMTAETAKLRKDLASQIKRARKAIQKADPKQAARLAEQRARAERRRAQQPRLPFEKASATRRMVEKSKAAAAKAGAARRPTGPAKDDEVLGEILSVKAERSGRYAQLTPAQRAAHAAADRQTPDVADLGFAKHGKVPIHEIRKAVAAKFGPEAAGKALDKQLFKLEAEGKIRLVAIGDRARATSQQLRESIPGVRETFFLVEPVAGAGRASAPKKERTAEDFNRIFGKIKEREKRIPSVQQALSADRGKNEGVAARSRMFQQTRRFEKVATESMMKTLARPATPKTGRASALKRLTGKSKAAAERAGAVAKGPVTAENYQAKVRAARKAQARDVKKSVASRPKQTEAEVMANRNALHRAKLASQARRAAEAASRKAAPSVPPVQTVPHRVGSVPRRDVAGQVAATTARIDAGRKAAGRGTPERAEKAVVKRVERAADATIRDLAKDHPGGLVPIPVIRDRLAAKLGPAAAGKVLDRVLMEKHGERLIAISDLRKATKGELAKAIPGVNETLYYVRGPRPSAVQAPARASGRGTPERAARAAGLRGQRAAVATKAPPVAAAIRKSDAAYEVVTASGVRKTLMVRAVKEDDEWRLAANETTLRGGVAPAAGRIGRVYENRAAAIAAIPSAVAERGNRSARPIKTPRRRIRA